jgi:hypothetical protein
MANYQVPGITITESTENAAAPLLATPDSMCLVGPVSGTIAATKTLTLSGTTPSQIISGTDSTIASDGIVSIIDLNPANADTEYNNSTGYPVGTSGFGGYF